MISAALHFPQIDPVLFSINVFGIELAIRWYALAYVAGFLLAWWWIGRMVRRVELWPAHTPPMTPKQVEDFLTWAIIGVILGGRIGYVFFYAFEGFRADPTMIYRVWEGGMSFHGGFLGVVVAGALFCWKNKVPPLSFGDALALGVPFGLFLGRIANFINAELWGRPTAQPWGVIFPNTPECPLFWLEPVCARHPSQLYEAVLEGVLLFAVILYLAISRGWLKQPGRIFGVFFVGYGAARIFVEMFRQGDSQFIGPNNPWGHVIRFGSEIDSAGLTMGQVLSVPMVLVGLFFLLRKSRG